VLVANTATAQTPVALWHMENPTVMTDSSGNRHSGRPTSGVSSVRGSSSRGYAFNGTKSVVVVPHSNALNPRGGNFTVTVHVRFSKVPTATQRTYDLIRKGTSTTPGGYWKAEIVRADATHARVGCYFGGSVNASAKRVAGDNLADGRWHTITCRRTATKISTIIDGVSASKTVTVGTIVNTQPVIVGAKFATGGDRYQGKMDEISIAVG
jgi:Concanavalin A-like lectin/glucanases superfamily